MLHVSKMLTATPISPTNYGAFLCTYITYKRTLCAFNKLIDFIVNDHNISSQPLNKTIPFTLLQTNVHSVPSLIPAGCTATKNYYNHRAYIKQCWWCVFILCVCCVYSFNDGLRFILAHGCQ